MAVTKTVITSVTTRAWNEIEPKVLTFLATGLSAGIITEWAGYAGYHVDPALAVAISTVIATVAGYIKKSTSKTEVPPVTVAPAVVEPVLAAVEPVAPVA